MYIGHSRLPNTHLLTSPRNERSRNHANFRQGKEIPILFRTLIMALEPNKVIVQWEQRAISQGLKEPLRLIAYPLSINPLAPKFSLKF